MAVAAASPLALLTRSSLMADTASEDLAGQVRAALQADGRLGRQRRPIEVHADGERVCLRGLVPRLADKRIALATAERIAGPERVVDELCVAVVESHGDDVLRDALVAAIQQQRELHNCTVRQADGQTPGLVQEAHDDWPSGEVELHVRDGEVTLVGKVISLSHKRLLESLAWRARGCTNVIDRLQVVPGEDDNDDEITDAVRLVLETDPLVRADQNGVRSADGVVTLAGALPAEAERVQAELDTWTVCGVRDVRNRIEVRPPQ
jgi:osmotically-inducible protein OsmY